MSGTAFGTIVLHVAPESAIGGPLALVRDGDEIELDVANRRLHLHVSDDELARRRAAWQPPAACLPPRLRPALHRARQPGPPRLRLRLPPRLRPCPRHGAVEVLIFKGISFFRQGGGIGIREFHTGGKTILKVFRMTDIDRYQFLLPEHREDAARLRMDGTPKQDTWVLPPSTFSHRIYSPAISTNRTIGILITDLRATGVLRRYLEWAGELLPLPYKDEIFTLLNVTECVDVLDYGRTVFAPTTTPGDSGRILQPAFHVDRFGEMSLFKNPEQARSQIYVVEGVLQGARRRGRYRFALDSHVCSPSRVAIK